MTLNSVGIIGSGAWGCALAHAFSKAGNEVMLWGRSAKTIDDINANHENKIYLVNLNENIDFIKIIFQENQNPVKYFLHFDLYQY